jgi:hypothetical protein
LYLEKRVEVDSKREREREGVWREREKEAREGSEEILARAV